MAIDFADLAVRVNYGDVDKAAQSLDRLKTASAGAEQSTGRMGATTVAATRNMGAWAALNAEASGKVGDHSLAIGRLGYRLESLTSEAVGANSAVGLLGASFLKFGVGDVYSIAILGGIYAIVKAYDLLTESTRKAKEEHDKLVASLTEGNADAALGPDPNLVKQVQAQRDQLRQEQERRRMLLAYGRDPNSDEMSQLNRQIAYDTGQLGAGEDRLTKARMQAQGFLPPVKIDSSYEQDRRKAEAQELEASKRYWETQSELWKRAREEVAKLNEEVRDYVRANPASDIVTRAIKGDIPTNVDLPHVGVDDGLTELQKRFHDLTKPFDAVGEAAYKVAKAMKDAADNIALFKESWKRGNIGSGAQAGAAGAIGDALLNFTPEGLAYTAVSTGINYAVQGLTDLGATLLGLGASATAARRAQRELMDEYKAAAASFRQDDLSSQLAQDADTFERLLGQTADQLNSVWAAIHNPNSHQQFGAATAAEIAQEARNQALIKQQAAEKQQYAQEDLEVRNLRATGHGDQADLLAFKEQQAREYQAAQEKAMADGVVTAAEQLYLNTLATTQNNELLAFQNGLLQDALRNAPTGFYGSAAYIGQFATPRGSTGLDSGITHPPVQPLQVVLKVDGKVLTSVMVNNLDQTAASTGGSGSSRSQALDLWN